MITFFWIIAAIIAIPMFLSGLFLKLAGSNRDMRDSLHGMGDADFLEMPFEEFPFLVRLRLARFRKELLKENFTELASFSRATIGMPNYAIYYVSPDSVTLAELEYVHMGPLTVFLILFVNPGLLFQSIIGIGGLSFLSVFPNYRRLITTKHAFLAKDQISGEKEYQVRPGGEKLRDMCEAHKRMTREISSNESLVVSQFRNKQDIFDFEKVVLRKLAARMEADAAILECR